MPKDIFYFICSCIIMLLTAINLSIGPIISKKVEIDSFLGGNLGTLNCKKWSDKYDDNKGIDSAKALKFSYERYKDYWYRKKAMYNLEYSSFIIDICIRFVCS